MTQDEKATRKVLWSEHDFHCREADKLLNKIKVLERNCNHEEYYECEGWFGSGAYKECKDCGREKHGGLWLTHQELINNRR